jgi:flagellar capping protein FliD
MRKIKLYDEKDLDYYNPKPFLLSMLSLFGEEDYKRLSNWVDSGLKHLFVGTLLKNNFIDTIKNDELDALIREVKNTLDRKANSLEDELRELEHKIKMCDSNIETAITSKNNYITQLEGLKNVIAKATRTNN